MSGKLLSACGSILFRFGGALGGMIGMCLGSLLIASGLEFSTGLRRPTRRMALPADGSSRWPLESEEPQSSIQRKVVVRVVVVVVVVVDDHSSIPYRRHVS